MPPKSRVPPLVVGLTIGVLVVVFVVLFL